MEMRIYTKTGDKGTSSLYSGERISKADHVFNVLGELDRLNCDLGFVRVMRSEHPCIQQIKPIQDMLIRIGSCIGTRPTNRQRYGKTRITDLELQTKQLECDIDDWTSRLPPLSTFLTPGESEHSTRAHTARTTCRSLERLIVSLCDDIKEEILQIQLSIDDARAAYEEKNSEAIQKEITDLITLYEDTTTLLSDLQEIAKYINRLSDYLFTLARYIEEKVESESYRWGWF